MKKIIIPILIVLVVLSLLPIIGNQLVSDSLDESIAKLELNGIAVKNDTVDSSYMNSFRHYEFYVSDTRKFLKYLEKYSDKQLPTYTSSLLHGSVVAADVEYSNIPFTKALSLDIYPIKVSDKIMNDVKIKDSDFHEYIKNLLEEKGILYHINYNVATQNFDGYIKNIDEKYTMKNNSKLVVDIFDANFLGNGSLLAPTSLELNAEKLIVKISSSLEERSIIINNFSSKSNFESRSTYLSSSELQNLQINLKTISGENVSLTTKNLFLNVSSNTQSQKAEFNSKLSFDNFLVHSSFEDLNISDFNYDISISEIDKDSLEELSVLISKAKSNSNVNETKQIKDKVLALFSKGLVIDIVDLSAKNIKLNKENLDGLSVKSNLVVKENPSLANSILYAPMTLVNYIDMNFRVALSKKIFSKIVSAQPMAIFAQRYAKKVGENIVFDFTFKDGNFKVNGKALSN